MAVSAWPYQLQALSDTLLVQLKWYWLPGDTDRGLALRLLIKAGLPLLASTALEPSDCGLCLAAAPLLSLPAAAVGSAHCSALGPIAVVCLAAAVGFAHCSALGPTAAVCLAAGGGFAHCSALEPVTVVCLAAAAGAGCLGLRWLSLACLD